jgi:hypothetical protein
MKKFRDWLKEAKSITYNTKVPFKQFRHTHNDVIMHNISGYIHNMSKGYTKPNKAVQTSIKGLQATQDWLIPNKEYDPEIDGTPNHRHAIIANIGKSRIIIDGHHRATRAYINGRETIKAHNYIIPETVLKSKNKIKWDDASWMHKKDK